MCILHALKASGSEPAHAWIASGGTFCNTGPGFGTLWVKKESQLLSLILGHCLRVGSFPDSVFGLFKQLC